jgi:hypothetical protein
VVFKAGLMQEDQAGWKRIPKMKAEDDNNAKRLPGGLMRASWHTTAAS